MTTKRTAPIAGRPGLPTPGGEFRLATPATHKQLAGGEIRGEIRDGQAVQISPTIELPD